MSEFGPQIAAQVVETCRTNAGEIGEALSRALDRPITVSIGDPIPRTPKLASGAGIILLLEIGAGAALIALPASTGMLPAWYLEADATGKSKLATLAQELGVLLLPEEFAPGDSSAFAVADLGAAIERGQFSAESGCIPITLNAEQKQHQVHLLWPAASPRAIRIQDSAATNAAPVAPAAAVPPDRMVLEERRPAQRPTDDDDPFEPLPPYSRSLLHIRVPVMVTLAAKKQPVSKIVELVPGSILQFNKSCDELLDLEVSGLPVAKGECVKVGDKFGLRVSSLVMPAERFTPVQ